jgi:hypothetical protein
MMTKIGNTTPVYSMDKLPSSSPQQHQIGDPYEIKITSGATDKMERKEFKPSDMPATTKYVANKLEDDDNAMSLFNQASLYGKVTQASILQFSLNNISDRSMDSELDILERMIKDHGTDGVLTEAQFKQHRSEYDKPLNNTLEAAATAGLRSF